MGSEMLPTRLSKICLVNLPYRCADYSRQGNLTSVNDLNKLYLVNGCGNELQRRLHFQLYTDHSTFVVGCGHAVIGRYIIICILNLN